jgi:hypothetical protein
MLQHRFISIFFFSPSDLISESSWLVPVVFFFHRDTYPSWVSSCDRLPKQNLCGTVPDLHFLSFLATCAGLCNQATFYCIRWLRKPKKIGLFFSEFKKKISCAPDLFFLEHSLVTRCFLDLVVSDNGQERRCFEYETAIAESRKPFHSSGTVPKPYLRIRHQ